ncbi:MAG: peptidoglycan-binding protein [Bifidobacteriaceae bacterium]|nr:peptidoglycan-binding protein [Bifidobacteriaceae bacterium]
MEGRDVAQLQAALDRLGFYSGDGAGVFDAATKAAVKRLYARVGYPAPATDGGAGDDAEAVVAGQAAVDAARAAVKAAEAGVAAADSELAGARDQERAARRALEDLRTARKAAAKAREKAEAKAVEQWNRARAAQTASPAAPTGDGGSIADLTLKQAVAEAFDGVAPAPGESEFAAAKDAVRAGERGVAGAQAGLAAAEDAVGEAKKQVGSAQAALGRLEARIGAVAPMAELAFAPVLPAFATAVASEVGFAAPAVLVALTPDSLEVRVGGMASVDALMLAEGLETELELPDGSVATGAVSQIVPETGGQTGSAVSITPDEPLDFALAGANLKVTFTAAQSAGEVLAVPQGALSSQPSGDLSVLLVGPADPATGEPVLTRVQVTTGVSGEGLVEVAPVEPGALEPGAKVVVSG